MGIVAAFSSLWVVVVMVSTVNARVINKRAAFYIANDTMCIVDGELYFNGDPVPTDDHCEKCTCRPPGFSCVLRDCEVKLGCKAVRKDGECCPDYICGCSHNGNVYKDGDFIRDLQNPCYTCRCHGSSISCTFADCLFRSDCGPEYIQGECCPRYDHCPPLSTTQKTTTVLTTVPITYDEITKPLFNLTSPPHERLATHTTIFPTTGSTTVDGGETHTTEAYVKPTLHTISAEATQTTSVHESTVTSSSESSTSRITEADTSTVKTSDSKTVTETSAEVYKDTSHEPVSLAGETVSTESFSTDTTFSATDMKTDTEAKDLTSASVTTELFPKSSTWTEELHDGETDESVTEVSYDIQPDETVTEVPHDNQADALETGVSHDDVEDESETELSSGSQTAALVTEASLDRQTDDSVEELTHDSETDNPQHVSDETVSVPFSEETSKDTSDVTEEDENEDSAESADDILEDITGMPTTQEELKMSSEDEVHSSHETFSLEPEMARGSEGTSPSSLTTGTLSEDSGREVSSIKAFITEKTSDIASQDTHSDATVSDDTSTEEIREDVVSSDTSLPAVTLHDDPETESEPEDKTTFSGTGHSDIGDSESSTIHSETKSHSLSTESMDDDDDDSTDELHTDADEISTQDAEELNLFNGVVTPSDGSHQTETTVIDHVSHLSTNEATHAQDVTSELSHEQSTDTSEVTDHLQTEHTEAIRFDVDDISSYDHSLSSVQGTIPTHSTEAPHPLRHTQYTLYSLITTTAQPVYTSDLQNETAVSDGENDDETEEFLSSFFADDVLEKISNVTQDTTEHLPDQIHPLNEMVAEENVAAEDIAQSSSEDHETPHLLSEGVNALSPTDEFNEEGQQIHSQTERSSQPSVIVTTEGTTETVITMEAESDLSFTTSAASSTIISAEDVSLTSSRAVEPSEELSMISESITTHAAETPVTLTSSPKVFSFGVHDSTTEHEAEDDLSIKSKEQELLFEESHITTTAPPEQDTSSPPGQDTSSPPEQDTSSPPEQDTSSSPPEQDTSSDNLGHSEPHTEVSSTTSSDDLDHSEPHTPSIISEADEKATPGSSTSITSDHISESTVAASSPEESNDGGRNDVSLTTKSAEIETTSLKQATDENKPTNAYEDHANAATSEVFMSDNFSKAKEQPETEKESTSLNELTTDSQLNIDDQITEHTSEITMDAEESIVNNGFESVIDYLYTTENYEKTFVSTTEDHATVSKDEGDTQGHYTIDGETYSAPNREHLRTSRSTSSNGTPSSITEQYPEQTELQTRHASESEKTTTGSVQDNTLESTQSTYLNSAEVSSHSLESLNEKLSTTPNTDDSYNSQVTKLITYEDGETNGANTQLDVHETEETSEDEQEEEVLLVSTVEISSSSEPATDLLKNNVAPDLIIPVEHQVNAVPFNSAETEKPMLSDHSTDVTEEYITNPPTTFTPKITLATSDSERDQAKTEESSESYDKNNVSERENDEDLISRFSRTSESYTTDEVIVGNDISTSTTENQQTISSYTMDAEAETDYLDDTIENNEEHIKDQSINHSPWSTQSNLEQTSVFESENGQNPSDSEEEELVGKEFQNGPEKGGEWFEPTVPVLSAINIHNDKTGTSADTLTTVKYPTSTDFKETVTPENDETSSFVTEMAVQMQKGLDNDHTHSSTLFEEEQHGELTTTSPNVRDFTSNDAVEAADKKSEVPSPTSSSYETTHLGDPDFVEDNKRSHHFSHTLVRVMDLNTDVSTTDGPQEKAGVTLTAKINFIGDEENESSSEGLNSETSSEVNEFEGREAGEDKFTEQTATTGETPEYAIKQDQSDESFRTVTTNSNSISQRDETESPAASEGEHKDATESHALREQKQTKEESTKYSQHEVETAGRGTTKESSLSLNDFMLADGTGNMMSFMGAITDSLDFITDYVSTTEPRSADEHLEKDLQNIGSDSEFHANPEQITNDKENEEPTIRIANSNGLKETKQSEELTTEELSSEKRTENSVSPKDHSEGFQPNNEDDYFTERSSTSHNKWIKPLPLLLLDEFVEKIKEDNLVNQNSQPVEEELSTVQPEEIDEVLEVLSELALDGTMKENLEKQSESDPEVINYHGILLTTQKNGNKHDSVPITTTSNYQEKQTEIYSTTARSEEIASQNLYSAGNSHSGNNPDESDKVTNSKTSIQVTEQSNKTKKNVSHIFVIRRSHDDSPSDEERPRKKEEYDVEKHSASYSDKSPEIAVNDPNDSNQEGHDEVAVTTEVITQHDEDSTNDAQQKNSRESDLGSSSTRRNSVEPTSSVDKNVEDTTASPSSSDDMFNSGSTEAEHHSEDELLKDAHEDISELETTPDSMNSDTA